MLIVIIDIADLRVYLLSSWRSRFRIRQEMLFSLSIFVIAFGNQNAIAYICRTSKCLLVSFIIYQINLVIAFCRTASIHRNIAIKCCHFALRHIDDAAFICFERNIAIHGHQVRPINEISIRIGHRNIAASQDDVTITAQAVFRCKRYILQCY